MQTTPQIDNSLLKKYRGKYTFFYGGWLSNWAPTEFTASTFSEVLKEKECEALPSGWLFSTSEQYMMLQKAICFEDWKIAWKVLHEQNPASQKALGRQVRNFDPELWNIMARAAVYEGCYYKFTHGTGFRKHLLSTQGSLLVEASPVDRIWGIGLGESDPRRINPENWQGANWLGEVLTLLREGFLNGNAHLNPYTVNREG